MSCTTYSIYTTHISLFGVAPKMSGDLNFMRWRFRGVHKRLAGIGRVMCVWRSRIIDGSSKCRAINIMIIAATAHTREYIANGHSRARSI